MIHYRTCPLCEAMCGLEIHVAGDRVELIRADRDDVWSRGHLCPKGTAVGHLHHDPDRIRRPMIREGRAPISSAAVQKSSSRSERSLERTARARPVQSRRPKISVMPK